MPALIVPERFNKNAPDVRAEGSQAETGTLLIDYMCQRLAVPNLRAVRRARFRLRLSLCGCDREQPSADRLLYRHRRRPRDDRFPRSQCCRSVPGLPSLERTQPILQSGWLSFYPRDLAPERAGVRFSLHVLGHHPRPVAGRRRRHCSTSFGDTSGRAAGMFFSARIDDMPDDYRELGSGPIKVLARVRIC